MGYCRERPHSEKLPSKEELIASIKDGSFLANVKPYSAKQKREEWLQYLRDLAADRHLFVGPPTFIEYMNDWHYEKPKGTGEDVRSWDDRYDRTGKFHPEWHD